MGVMLKKEVGQTIIGVWKTTETLEKLISLSKNIDISHLKKKKRKKEFLSTRLLLKQISPESTIIYDKNGSPNLNEDKYISITHSKNLVGIIISAKNNGIDIEQISEKSLKVSSKFINPNQLKNLTKEKSTLIWCLKEAIFKWNRKGEVHFKKDILISEFKINEHGSVPVKFKGETIIAEYFKIENQFLVYVCK